MRRLALGEVGYVGDSSNRFNIGGVGDRFWPRRAGWLRAAGGRATVFGPGSERPGSCGDTGYSRARAGVAPPTGRRPRGTNENAPLPKLGPLISSSLFKPLTPT